MSQHIFQFESELQNSPEAAPKASPSFSVSEKLARYGSSALSSVEHLTLLVGKESMAQALIRYFGSLKALSRASFLELRQFLPQQKAEAVIAALSMSAIAESEHALSDRLDSPEAIYNACADMKLLNQEVLRVILLDARYRHFSTMRNHERDGQRISGASSRNISARNRTFGVRLCTGTQPPVWRP
jgi:DNA repair protein RadC